MPVGEYFKILYNPFCCIAIRKLGFVIVTSNTSFSLRRESEWNLENNNQVCDLLLLLLLRVVSFRKCQEIILPLHVRSPWKPPQMGCFRVTVLWTMHFLLPYYKSSSSWHSLESLPCFSARSDSLVWSQRLS
jgi:hypothetical protein